MTESSRALTLLPVEFSICKLPPEEPIPTWARESQFFAITRTDEELSIVCESTHVPAGTNCEPGWRALKLSGPLDFSLTGVLASLLVPLADAKISIFALSTFNTDYVLVKQDRVADAIRILSDNGYAIVDSVED